MLLVNTGAPEFAAGTTLMRSRCSPRPEANLMLSKVAEPAAVATETVPSTAPVSAGLVLGATSTPTL